MQLEDIDLRPTAKFPTPFYIALLAFALIPFVMSSVSWSVECINGAVAQSRYRDSVALTCGYAALIAGALGAIVLRRTPPELRLRYLALGALLIGLAVLQVLRGYGVVGVPDPSCRM